MSANLKKLQDFVNEMKSTSSLLEKKAIIETIKDNSFIRDALYYTYNPFLKYYVTSNNCKKNSELCVTNEKNQTLVQVLNCLNDRWYTGHEAISMVNGFISQNKKYEDLIFSIIDRNLEIRASESVINKVIPNLIPEFKVALANSYNPKLVDWNDTWYASRKLDGVRCLAIVDEEGNCKLYSRQGNEFTTLDNVKKAIEDTNIINVVFDGASPYALAYKKFEGS